MDVLTASVPVAAYRATAMTAEEIDTHPDGARIWATIKMMRGEIESATDDLSAREAEIREDAFDDGYDQGKTDLRKDVERAIKNAERFAKTMDCPAWVLSMLSDIGGEIQ